LGRTGQKLTIIGMGGARFRLIPFEEGPPLVRRAYDLGINYFDMARGYAAKGASGHAEEAYGAAIPPFRKNIFLTTKSGRRTRKEAEADLDASLKLLKTDYVDLWQVHGVNRPEDIERLLAPNGALEAFEAAKKAGKCRFIGFTGHADPAVNLALLRQYDKFDTVFMPLHVADTVYKSFEKGTLPTAAERGMGIFAMKVLAHAHNLRGFTLQECLSYVLSLPITAAALGFATMGQLEDDVRIAQAFKPLGKAEMDALRERAASDRFDITNGPTLEYWKRNT
jgi:aryl-alcohol dehydrogenase-like predicted oxidoreductase